MKITFFEIIQLINLFLLMIQYIIIIPCKILYNNAYGSDEKLNYKNRKQLLLDLIPLYAWFSFLSEYIFSKSTFLNNIKNIWHTKK